MSQVPPSQGGDGSTPPAQAPDEIKNLKGEIQRKFDNINTQMSQVLDALKKPAPSATPTREDKADPKLEDLMFSDPEAYHKRIISMAEESAHVRLNNVLAAEGEKNATLASLVNDYPELSDQQSDLFKAAVEKYNALPAKAKESPIAYKAAVQEAALDMGVAPVRKRKQAQGGGDFSFGGGSGSNSARQSQGGGDGPIDQRTMLFAEACNLDIKDPKVLERLKTYSKRDFKKYGG